MDEDTKRQVNATGKDLQDIGGDGGINRRKSRPTLGCLIDDDDEIVKMSNSHCSTNLQTLIYSGKQSSQL